MHIRAGTLFVLHALDKTLLQSPCIYVEDECDMSEKKTLIYIVSDNFSSNNIIIKKTKKHRFQLLFSLPPP